MTKKQQHRNCAYLISITFVLFLTFTLFLLPLAVSAGCAGMGCCDLCENYANDSAQVTANFPVIIINKTITPQKFEQGDIVKFKIEVINLGNADGYKISINDILDRNFDFVKPFDYSNTEYRLYKHLFNASGTNKYECQQENDSWTTNYSTCVPKDTIKFQNYLVEGGTSLTWGRFGQESYNKIIPPKTAFIIEFFARAKENASTTNFTNDVHADVHSGPYDYICDGEQVPSSSCLGGTCESAPGQSCTSSECHCDGCINKPDDKCSDTKINVNDYAGLTSTSNVTPNFNASANFTVLPKSEIYITKEINSTNTTTNKFEVNSLITFVLSADTNLNLTNGTLSDVKIIDELPYGIEFLNATLCNETNVTLNLTTQPLLNKSNTDNPQAASILTIDIKNLTKDKPGIKICVNTRIASDTSNVYGALKNNVKISAKNIRAYETKNLSGEAEKYFYIQKPANLKISKKTLTTNVIPNSIAAYEITVWNEGDSEAVNITIFDNLPCNFVYINSSCNVTENNTPLNLTCPGENTTKPSFNISRMNGHSRIVFTFNVSVPGNVSGMCGNTIVAEAKDTVGNNLTVNYITQTSYIYTNPGYGYLQVNKEVLNNTLFAVGDIVTYKIKVRNSGNVQSVNNVRLKEFLPLGMKFSSINISNCNRTNITGNYSTDGEILTCNIGSITPNTTKIYYLNATIIDYKPVMVNKVEVNGSTSDGEQWFKDSVGIYLGEAKLKISKTASSTNAKPGENVKYTLNISNPGDATAYNVSIKDTLPARWSIVGIESATVSCTDGNNNISKSFASQGGFFGSPIITTLQFNRQNLSPGASCTISYDVKIPSDASMGLYANNARIEGKDVLNNSLLGDKTYRDILVYEFKDVGLIKVADKIIVKVGENVTFTITVRNTGNVNYNVSLTDELPYGFVNTTPLNYIFNLNAGSITNKTVKAIATTNAIQGLNANCVKASAYINNKLVLERKDCAFVYVSSPSIEIKKQTTTPTVNPGDNATFFVRVKNKGTENITYLNLTDNIVGINLLSTDVSISKVNCSGNIIIGNYPNIAAGNLSRGEECTINYTFKVPLNGSGLYQNVVYATASTITGTINESDKAYFNVIYNPKFSVWKTANASKIDVDESVNFTIFVDNEGNVPLNLSLSDVLPDNFINLTPLSFTDANAINPGENRNYTVIAKPNSNAVDSDNCVFINATTPKNEILSKIACTTIHIKKPLLLIDKWTTTPSRLPNETAEFYIMFKNDGEGTAKNIRVTDESNLTNTSKVVAYDGDCNSLNITNYPNLISNGTLHSNQYCIVHYNMTVPNVAGYANIATLNATDSGNKQLNVEKAAAYVLASGITPSFSVEKFVSYGSHFAERGTYKNFTVKVKNLGNVYINITNLNETPPYGFDCTGGSNITGKTLQPGETAATNITCFINKSALAGVNINEVRVLATGNGNVIISQSDNEFVIVLEPKLKISKTVSTKNAKPGENVEYILNISNPGDVTAYNISIKDTLPAKWSKVGTEFATVSCTDGNNNISKSSASHGGSFGIPIITTLQFNRQNLSPGTSCTISYQVNIPSDTSTGLYANDARIEGNDKGNITISDETKETVYIKGSPIMFVTLIANTTYLKKGAAVKFTLRVENLGDVELGNVQAVYSLPPGFENLSPLSVSMPNIAVNRYKESSVVARVLNDTNASIGGAHVTRVYVNATSFGGTNMKAESYATVYITSTPLSLIGDVDEKTLFIGSHLKTRFIIINPSMFDTQDINLTVQLPDNLKYDANSTMFNGIPLSDDENNGIVKNEDGKEIIEWNNLNMYSKSIGILTFSALVEDDVAGKTINASIIYNQHGEFGTANNSIVINQEFVSKPFFYVLQDKEMVNANETIKYTLIINDEFNKLNNTILNNTILNNTILNNTILKLTANGLKILDAELKNNKENRIYGNGIYLNGIYGEGINGKIINLTNLTRQVEIDIYCLPSPVTSPKLNLDAILTYNDGNNSKILQINKITDLLIPPEGIITYSESQNLNLTINLKDTFLNYTLHLKKGWNLIGIPVMPEKTDPEEILKPIEGKWTDVFTYEGRWVYKSKYMNKWFGDLSEIKPGKGYWLKVDEDVNLTLQGYEIKNSSIRLHPGWNLVSLPTLENIKVSGNDTDSKIFNYTDIFTYESNWIYRSSYMNKWFGNLENTEPGKGYWIKTDNFNNIRI